MASLAAVTFADNPVALIAIALSSDCLLVDGKRSVQHGAVLKVLQ